MKRRALLGFLSFLLLQSCLEEKVGGGTSTETENSASARAILVDTILDPCQRLPGGATVATLRFGPGNFDFDSTRDLGRDLDVRAMDSTTPIPFDVVVWDPAARIGRLHVRLEGRQLLPGAGFLLFWKLPSADRSDSAAVWKGISDSQRLLLNSTLVDDFESGNLGRSRLPDTSFWYLAGIPGISGISSPGANGSVNALHLVCPTVQCDSSPTLAAATLLAGTPRSFRSMDSIAFRARGKGKIWIALEYLDSAQIAVMQRGRIDSLQPRRTWASHDLDSVWRPISLKPADFDSRQGGTALGWNAVRDSVNYMTILIEGGSEMWIDDIRLHGLIPADLR